MDTVHAKIADEGIKFGPGDDVRWRQTFEPLYPEIPKDVQVIRDERYGPAERNFLDVYVPSNEDADKPIMLYVHGGGFHSGDKRWSEKCYANVGYFFAQHGIVTVVANHQLVPHVQYPGGAEDVQLIREWIHGNIEAERFGRGCANKVILVGHSSGGAHIAMNLFAAGDPQRMSKTPVHPPVAGVAFLGAPFWYDRTKPVRQRTIRHYYGSDTVEVWAPKSALGLFERLPEDSLVLDSRILPVYVGIVEWEQPETTDGNVMFFNAYRSRSKPGGTLPNFHVLKGHNHLTGVLSIGTEDTAQADQVLWFVGECLGQDFSDKSSVKSQDDSAHHSRL